MDDPNENFLGVYFLNNAADLAVIKPNRLSRFDVVKYLWNRSADDGRTQQPPISVVRSRSTWIKVP